MGVWTTPLNILKRKEIQCWGNWNNLFWYMNIWFECKYLNFRIEVKARQLALTSKSQQPSSEEDSWLEEESSEEKIFFGKFWQQQESSENNVTPQSLLKEKLKNAKKDVVKFFEENSCPVCLSSYKEILDEDLHIVVSKCGHPFCCKCSIFFLFRALCSFN